MKPKRKKLQKNTQIKKKKTGQKEKKHKKGLFFS